MLQQIATYDISDEVVPAQQPGDARIDAMVFGASLTILAGDLIAQSTVDKLAYRYVAAGANGLGIAVGISKYSFVTDAAGRAYMGTSVTAVPSLLNTFHSTMPVWKNGIFDPTTLKVGGAATTVAAITTAFTWVRKLVNGFVEIIGK